MTRQSSGRPRKPASKARPCPICGAPARQATRPFCSRRCADLDLGRWITGAYRIPTEERPDSRPPESGSEDGGSDDET